MGELWAFALAFLQASVTCVAAAAVLWLVLSLLRRRWPGMASQRAVWALAMAAAAAAFVLALPVAPDGWRLLPAIEMARPAAIAAAGPATERASVLMTKPVSGPAEASHGGAGAAGATEVVAAAGDGASAGGQVLPDTPAPGWLLATAAAWLLCYAAGLALAVARLLRARKALGGLLACATPLDGRALAHHPGFEDVAGLSSGPIVMEADAPVSPMLAGLLQPVLLVPRHLRAFAPGQQQLMVAHELAHWQRRDHLWLHASLFLQTVLWFNRPLKVLGAGLAHAQELGCDRQVLAGRPMATRRDYAAALVAQLSLQQGGNAGLAAAFGGSGAAALGERIRQLRMPDLGGATRLATAGKAALGACCAAVIGAGMLLQPAFAWRAAPAAQATGLAASAALPAWQAPLSHVSVASGYGPRLNQPTPQASRFHHGVDLRARRGTPLLAVADGVVTESTDLYQGASKYGKVIVIEHGNGLRSMYAHLDQRSVQPGDAVTAGQAIGKTGNTGKTTGPHLHFEVEHDGVAIDPQRLIGALRAH